MYFGRKNTLWTALGGLMMGGKVAEAQITLDLSSTDSIKSAASTIAHNMVSYYHGNETGQIPGLLPLPYYWWEAGSMFGLLIEYWYLTGDASYNDIVTDAILFQVGANDFMPTNQTKDLGNDDQAFWAFTALTAAELKFPDPPAGQPSWLALAQAVFNEQANRWDTATCNGGLRWQIYSFNAGYDYKNTISTGGFFQLAARLARFTGNQTYADWAGKSWDWMQQSPLITKDWKIWDGTAVGKNCIDANQIYWTYNYGTMLMGSAFMFNYTNGNSTWNDRVNGILGGTDVFFVNSVGSEVNVGPAPPNGQIMAEVACEFPNPETCNYDQPSFKSYLSRWMALTTQLVPNTTSIIMPRIQKSAMAAAQQCSGQVAGQPIGTVCGRRWYQNTWDGQYGVGEQMSALSIIQSNLITKVAPPVTADKGGTSQGDPSAGSSGTDGGNVITNPVLTKSIGGADKAGAGILTALTLVIILGMTWWIVV